MKVYSFNAKIYKVGINPCVKVPYAISDRLKSVKGYIRVMGKIEGHPFTQTLVPIKNDHYRLFVNGPMLKGSSMRVGLAARFTLSQNEAPPSREFPMPAELRMNLESHGLMSVFKGLIPSRQKEIKRYLGNLKTTKSRERNMKKIIQSLQLIQVNP